MKLFRTISILEGCSFLLLLLIAMPLKYIAGMPEVVSVVGMAHGLLFILYTTFSLNVSQRYGWSTGSWFFILMAGMVPFGFLIIDKRLKAVIEREPEGGIA